MKKIILLLFASGCLFGNTPYIPHIYESGQISIGDVEINVVVNDQGNLTQLSENDRKVAIEYDPLGNPISFTYNGERTTQFLFEEDQLVGKILPDERRIQFEALDDDVTIKGNQLIIDGICEITYTEDQIIYKDQQGNQHIHTYGDGYEEMMDGQGCISYGKGEIRTPEYTEKLIFENGLPIGRNVNGNDQFFHYDERLQFGDYVDLHRNEIDAQVNSLDQITQLGSLIFSYDTNGNVISKTTHLGVTHYTYDKNDYLCRVETPTKTITFENDLQGRRKTKSINGELFEKYLYHRHNCIAILHPNGKLKELRIPGWTTHPDILKPVAIHTEKGLFTTLHDHFGNIVLLKQEGKKSIAINHDPFGRKLRSQVRKSPTTAIYSSHYYDPDIELLYCNARYYDPVTLRYISPDPCMLAGGINPYAYKFNNPLIYRDPTGKVVIFAIPLTWGAAALASAIYAAYVSYHCYQNSHPHDRSHMMTPPQKKELLETAYGPAISGTLYDNQSYGMQEGYSLLYLPTENLRTTGQHLDTSRMERSKKGGVDDSLPINPENDKNWEDVSHPDAKKNGHSTFRNKKTGGIIEYDKGKPGKPGHKGHDHYHRPNPNKSGKDDWYLDAKKNPVADSSEASHLYPPDWVWWE